MRSGLAPITFIFITRCHFKALSYPSRWSVWLGKILFYIVDCIVHMVKFEIEDRMGKLLDRLTDYVFFIIV